MNSASPDFGSPTTPAAAHRDAAPNHVACAILTISDSRTRETDESGKLIRGLLDLSGHTIADYQIVPDNPARIRTVMEAWRARADIQVMLSNGGTGIAARDTTYDALASLLDKRIDGFGELFRMLSYQEIGAAAMLSRAMAGVYGGKILIAMPGSTNAVKLAMTKLILPELGHLVYEASK